MMFIYKPFDIRVSKKYPFLSASIDGELIELETGRKGTYEGKTAIVRTWDELKNWLADEPKYLCIISLNVFTICMFVSTNLQY